MKSRDYKDEYGKFQSSPKSKRDRAARNKARRQSGLKRGDSREVDHKVPLARGGSYGKSNRAIVSRHYNRVKGKKR